MFRSTDACTIQRAPRLLVSRMLSRAIARETSLGVLDAVVHRFGCFPDAEEIPPCISTVRSRGVDSEELQRRAVASAVCRHLLQVCVLAAGVSADALAQVLLLQMYRRAGRRRFDEDEQLVSLCLRLCGLTDWARCAACCVRLRAVCGVSNQLVITHWLRDHSVESRKESMKLAIQHNTTVLLRPLVEAGADVNCTFEQFWFRTPLHRASSRGHKEACRILLSLRADPARRDSHGAAPIHLVASKGRLPIVELLLRHDPSGVAAVDHSGRTPCHMAALKGHLTVVELLVAAGADAAAQALDARAPADMARRGQHAEVERFLEASLRRKALAAEARPAARQVLEQIFSRLFDLAAAEPWPRRLAG
mmetsp:Transcript_12641/g.39848  ORF Transcript_12641/g.39848 Transcript_12641/m.39848 type:complete len:364 (-) Transcript_12641:298-1389(-)